MKIDTHRPRYIPTSDQWKTTFAEPAQSKATFNQPTEDDI